MSQKAKREEKKEEPTLLFKVLLFLPPAAATSPRQKKQKSSLIPSPHDRVRSDSGERADRQTRQPSHTPRKKLLAHTAPGRLHRGSASAALTFVSTAPITLVAGLSQRREGSEATSIFFIAVTCVLFAPFWDLQGYSFCQRIPTDAATRKAIPSLFAARICTLLDCAAGRQMRDRGRVTLNPRLARSSVVVVVVAECGNGAAVTASRCAYRPSEREST